MHGQNVEFGSLILRKFSFLREIFATLRGNSSFRWISVFFLQIILTIYIFDNIPEFFFAFFPALLLENYCLMPQDGAILCLILRQASN